MWHTIDVCHACFPTFSTPQASKLDAIAFNDILPSKESKINDDTRVSLRSNVAIGKGIAMDLDVPGRVRFVRDHDLRFRITEGNGQWVIRMTFVVLLDLLLECGIFPDGIDD